MKAKIKSNAKAPAPPRPYHHGDLRQAVIDAGLRLLMSRPLDELGLREVAREVGVSATALYRHFADKQALKSALAQAGLDRLARAQVAASARAGGGQAGFLASGLAYVRFALEQPVLFRLVFSHAPPDNVLDAAPDQVSDALRCLRQDIAALLPPGRPEAEHKAAALHAWALVHGLAMLVLDRQIPDDPALIEQALCGFAGVLQPPTPGLQAARPAAKSRARPASKQSVAPSAEPAAQASAKPAAKARPRSGTRRAG